MNKFTNPLNNIKIASPCQADWNAMIGNERQRFCGECKLNVYNLSGMSKTEAENLLLNAEGRLCVRFYKRADGTVLTQDCPVGWQAVKQRISKTAAAFAALVFGVLSSLGLTAFFSQSNNETLMGKIVYQATPKNTPEPLMGAMAVTTPTPKATPKREEFIMGDFYIPTPTPKATPKNKKDAGVLMGRVIAPRN